MKRNTNKPFWSPTALDSIDQALASCDNIATLGGLLAATNPGNPPDFLDPALAAHAGQMIAREAEYLHELIASLSNRMTP
jgi:hypothetical protein